jgi:DNA-binding response OmpR family regulator
MQESLVNSPEYLDILVIEDDPSIRELVTLSLRDAGHRVIESSARHALALPQTAPVSLIVVDCNTPKPASARTVIHRLRSRYPLAVVVAISGYFAAHATCDAELASALGADCTMGKPFRCEELVALVQRLSRSAIQATPEN